jgi:Ca2+/H+ antiporter
MNLAIGSALAGIGLNVPVVVPASIVFDLPLVLGLEPKDIAMLAPISMWFRAKISASMTAAQSWLGGLVENRGDSRSEARCKACETGIGIRVPKELMK